MDLSPWRRRGGATALLLATVALAADEPQPVRAQAVGDAATVAELRRTVEDLQRRVRELERRLAAGTSAPKKAAEAAPAPAPPAPALAPSPRPPTTAEAAPAPAAPAPAPGQVQVSKEAAATALERALVQRGAALLRSGAVQVEPSLSLARLEATEEPVSLARGGQPVIVGSGQGRQRRNILSAGLGLRFGLPWDTELTLDVPYRYVDTSTVSQAASGELHDRGREATGFGDLAVGLSKQLLHEGGWRPDLVAGVIWDTDTGQTEHGISLGSGFNEVTAGLTASRSQDPLVFVGQLAYTHAFEEGRVEPGDVYGLSLGAVLGASPETSLRFFFDQNFVQRAEDHGHGVPGSDAWVGLLSIGASSVLSRRVLLDAELGIGLTPDAPDYIFRVALPIQFDLPFSWASATHR